MAGTLNPNASRLALSPQGGEYLECTVTASGENAYITTSRVSSYAIYTSQYVYLDTTNVPSAGASLDHVKTFSAIRHSNAEDTTVAQLEFVGHIGAIKWNYKGYDGSVISLASANASLDVWKLYEFQYDPGVNEWGIRVGGEDHSDGTFSSTTILPKNYYAGIVDYKSLSAFNWIVGLDNLQWDTDDWVGGTRNLSCYISPALSIENLFGKYAGLNLNINTELSLLTSINVLKSISASINTILRMSRVGGSVAIAGDDSWSDSDDDSWSDSDDDSWRGASGGSSPFLSVIRALTSEVENSLIINPGLSNISSLSSIIAASLIVNGVIRQTIDLISSINSELEINGVSSITREMLGDIECSLLLTTSVMNILKNMSSELAMALSFITAFSADKNMSAHVLNELIVSGTFTQYISLVGSIAARLQRRSFDYSSFVNGSGDYKDLSNAIAISLAIAANLTTGDFQFLDDGGFSFTDDGGLSWDE